MALNPYQRKRSPTYRAGIGDPPKPSRLPWLIGAAAFVGMLVLVYFLSTAQWYTWTVQSPP